MAVKSAKNGSVTFNSSVVLDVTDITHTDTVNAQTIATSSTGGNITRYSGHSDASGSFTVAARKADLSFSEGDEQTLKIDDDTGSTLFNGTALITDIEESVPVEGGTNVSCTVSYGQVVDSSSGG